MTKLTIGVAGTGHLGSLHAKTLAGIPGVSLAGLYDIDTARSVALANELGTKSFSSYAELLEQCRAVIIATPTKTHAEVARMAIAKGVHVFIEKPITASTDDGRALVEEARRKNVKVQVGHIERFNPALLALEKYHVRPMFVESHRLAQFNPRGTDVAVVLDLMIHDIDVIMSLVQSGVSSIQANGVAVVSDNVDIANARIQFENGCVANVTASRISQRKMRKMRMFQRDAYISVDFLDGVAEVFRLVDDDDESAKATMKLGAIETGSKKRNIVYEQPEIKEVNALTYELTAFARAIADGGDPVVTGEEGVAALEVAHEIMEKISRQIFRI
jgi:predicted dehydrogenase